ncbi:MAG: alpha/beta hydrolase family protein [Granulosicoccus sp.]|nr:alpha/beta hydrolase family protein [Granulosicoccus sp.]
MKWLTLFTLLAGTLVHATDVDREKRWIEQTANMIFDGDVQYLDTGSHEFYAIYTESNSASTRGMIVLHGTGFHPNYEQVVRPVRVGMIDHGWNTLSIQLPILEKSAEYEDYVSLYPEVPPRLDAAVKFLKDSGNEKIVIVAHSQGATMAAYYLGNQVHSIDAFVAIGMSAQHTQLDVNSAESLKKIDIPVLDIFGSKDFPVVLATNTRRSESAAHNRDYVQVEIEGAYHFFDLFEDELLAAIHDWLDLYN